MHRVYGVDFFVNVPGDRPTLAIEFFAWDGGGVVCGVTLCDSSYIPFCHVVDTLGVFPQKISDRVSMSYTDALWIECRVRNQSTATVVDIYVNTFMVGTATIDDGLIKSPTSTLSNVVVNDCQASMFGVYQYLDDANIMPFQPRIKYLADVERVTEVTRLEL